MSEAILQSVGYEEGVFIVRVLPSAKPGAQYGLAVAVNGETQHFLVGMYRGVFTVDKKPVLIPELDRPAMTLVELILQLSKTGEDYIHTQLSGFVARFEVPVEYISSSGQRPDWMHGILQEAQAETMIREKGSKDGLFLVFEYSPSTAMLSFLHRDKVLHQQLIFEEETWSLNKVRARDCRTLEEFISLLHNPEHSYPMPGFLTDPVESVATITLVSAIPYEDLEHTITRMAHKSIDLFSSDFSNPPQTVFVTSSELGTPASF